MARAIVAVAVFLSATVQSAFAADPSPDLAETTDHVTVVVPDNVQAAADNTGKDPVALAGAVNSTGLDPEAYLCGVGEGPCPKPPSPPPVVSPIAYAAPSGGVWAMLAQCESTGNWRANTGNSYYGGLQEDLAFWRRYGGLAYAARPDLASASAQIAVAQAGLASQGYGAWPVCSRRLGLR
jgi:hypothetical protein